MPGFCEDRRVTAEAYFERRVDGGFTPTGHVSGAWNPDEQHIAPTMGLLAHLIEQDHTARRGGELRLARFSAEILGVLTMDAVTVTIRVIRPGRTIELVEAELAQHGRTAVLARAWLLQRTNTSAIDGTTLERMPAPDGFTEGTFAKRWMGAFVASVETRTEHIDDRHMHCWVRPRLAVLAGEEVSPLARAIGVLDIANGQVPWADPARVLFPNIDLSASIFRDPAPGWIGLDVHVSVGPDGTGTTASVIHDEQGPLGTLTQTLTVRPRY